MSELDDLIDSQDFDSDDVWPGNLSFLKGEPATWGIKRLKKARRYYGLLLLDNPENQDAQKKERELTRYIFKARKKIRYIEGEK